ncbi:MAG: hypothetical protein GX413_02630 [Acetobacter sp.]|jgi:predicted secreted protein|nr:hypothetical protein [Acetobacter sp.]
MKSLFAAALLGVSVTLASSMAIAAPHHHHAPTKAATDKTTTADLNAKSLSDAKHDLPGTTGISTPATPASTTPTVPGTSPTVVPGTGVTTPIPSKAPSVPSVPSGE